MAAFVVALPGLTPRAYWQLTRGERDALLQRLQQGQN